ncbi:MAG: glycosyltransferase family 4 protein [Bifidobacterium sp.]|jgi:spore coat protein SA
MVPVPSSVPRKKVAIITSGYLPVPNVLGGAVEALDMMLIRQNEKNAVCEFTVFSSWAKGVDDLAGGIRHTSFDFIKTPRIVLAADRCVFAAAKYLLHKRKLMSYRYIAQRLWYIRKVAETLSHENFDAVIIENHATLFMTMKHYGNAERYAGKVYYHLHNEVTNDFGCAHEIARVRKVLGVSRFIVDTLDRFLREHGEKGLKPEQRAVWRNCVDTERFNPKNESTQEAGAAWRRKLGIRPDEIVFLFSGRLTGEKGAAELLKAFTKADLENARLVVAGSFFFDSKIAGPFERMLHAMAEQAGERIVFTGFVKYEDMPGIYAMSDVCVLPSIWDDPAPLAVIEAMASGRALITTRSGGIPEYADESAALILSRGQRLTDDLAKGMRYVAQHDAEREKIASCGYSRGKQLNAVRYMADFSRALGDQRI